MMPSLDTPASNIPTLNAHPTELAKFNRLASRWWDKESDFKPLHAINPLRLNWIEEHVKGLNHKRVLDVGCGGGILAESMAAQGAQVSGIDLARDSLEVARLHGLESGIKVDYQAVPVEKLALEQPNRYDIVTCMEMLEHVPDPASVIQACANLVKAGGWVFFSTLNRNLKSFLFAIVGAEYVLRLLPKGTHDYENFIKPSELATTARQANLSLQAIIGLTYHPITERYQLSTDTDVNYLMAMCKQA